jgi:hypothetical protein
MEVAPIEHQTFEVCMACDGMNDISVNMPAP